VCVCIFLFSLVASKTFYDMTFERQYPLGDVPHSFLFYYFFIFSFTDNEKKKKKKKAKHFTRHIQTDTLKTVLRETTHTHTHSLSLSLSLSRGEEETFTFLHQHQHTEDFERL